MSDAEMVIEFLVQNYNADQGYAENAVYSYMSVNSVAGKSVEEVAYEIASFW